MAEICLWCPPVCCFPALLYASLPGRTCAGMGLKCLNSPCPLLKNSTVLAFQWAACVKCPADHWMKRVILQFSSNENDFWEGCRLRAMLLLQYYQYILAANVISFFFNIKGRGYDFWAVIVWRHYLGRPPKLSCINLDVLDMSSVLLQPLRRVLDRDWCLQKAQKLQIMCFDVSPRVSLACFLCYCGWSFFRIRSRAICSHSSQF